MCAEEYTVQLNRDQFLEEGNMQDGTLDLTAEAVLDSNTFHSFLAHIRPTPDELKWTGIPWETDLWEARLRAAAANRPMFIWAINGNPLGCV